jgi:hypothetical protein
MDAFPSLALQAGVSVSKFASRQITHLPSGSLRKIESTFPLWRFAG